MSRCPAELHPTTWAVLRALRAGARISRNRHFYLHTDPRVRRAMQLHRFLRSVVHDVRTYPDELRVERLVPNGHRDLALRIEFPLLRGRRIAYLAAFELELLANDAPEVARLLTDAAAS